MTCRCAEKNILAAVKHGMWLCDPLETYQEVPEENLSYSERKLKLERHWMFLLDDDPRPRSHPIWTKPITAEILLCWIENEFQWSISILVGTGLV